MCLGDDFLENTQRISELYELDLHYCFYKCWYTVTGMQKAFSWLSYAMVTVTIELQGLIKVSKHYCRNQAVPSVKKTWAALYLWFPSVKSSTKGLTDCEQTKNQHKLYIFTILYPLYLA